MRMSERANIHATCIRIARAGKPFGAPASAGVLILGRSGRGKSDLALRLIALGAELVSDDRTDLAAIGNRLVATPPKTIAGLLEVRGIGIARMKHARRAAVVLVVDLDAKPKRLPGIRHYVPPLALPAKARPRLIALDAFEVSAPQKVLIAAGGGLLP
jgi:serine kinase of HPr protein (carbohydrate metabolism regulator)